jgi:type IV pilus assembly protein PilM
VGTVQDDAKTPILQQVTEIIVLEIQKTFDFFRASAAGEHIEKIYLAGGSAKVPGLVEALRQEFSMPVELFNPFQKVWLRWMAPGRNWWNRTRASWQWPWVWP